MHQELNRRDILRAAMAGATLYSTVGHAQSSWPSKPVTMIVPFPAGGGTDAFARPLAAQFTKLSGKALVIDNRGGAGGTLGAGIAAKAAPDGYTLFMGAVHHTIAPSMLPQARLRPGARSGAADPGGQRAPGAGGERQEVRQPGFQGLS